MTCCVKECVNEIQARGFCATHLWRLNKFGDPTKGGPVKHRDRGGITKHPLYYAWAGMRGDAAILNTAVIATTGPWALSFASGGRTSLISLLTWESGPQARHWTASMPPVLIPQTTAGGQLRASRGAIFRWTETGDNATAREPGR